MVSMPDSVVKYRLQVFLQSVSGVLTHDFLFILLLSTGWRLSGKRKFRHQTVSGASSAGQAAYQPPHQGGACQALRRADAVLVNATIFDRLISTELSGMVSIRSQFFHRSSLPPVITRLCL